MSKQMRVVWPLLKARVSKLSEGSCTLAIGAEYGSPTTFTLTGDMRSYDLREGDLLTVYTEVLLKEAKGGTQ